MQDPDHGLVSRAQKGDKTALGKLIGKYYDMAFAVAYGVLNQREEAQDVAQNVLLKVSKDIQNFHGKSKFKTWLYRVVVNAAIDATRRRKPADSIEAVPEPRSHQSGPLESASQAESAVIVREALEHLTPEHKTVLVLREWDGQSYEEIAETLEVTVGTVMSRLFYARKNLEKVLRTKLKDKDVV
jgi:RNA polymerase sigma-70 factor, ECF subfamily